MGRTSGVAAIRPARSIHPQRRILPTLDQPDPAVCSGRIGESHVVPRPRDVADGGSGPREHAFAHRALHAGIGRLHAPGRTCGSLRIHQGDDPLPRPEDSRPGDGRNLQDPRGPVPHLGVLRLHRERRRRRLLRDRLPDPDQPIPHVRLPPPGYRRFQGDRDARGAGHGRPQGHQARNADHRRRGQPHGEARTDTRTDAGAVARTVAGAVVHSFPRAFGNADGTTDLDAKSEPIPHRGARTDPIDSDSDIALRQPGANDAEHGRHPEVRGPRSRPSATARQRARGHRRQDLRRRPQHRTQGRNPAARHHDGREGNRRREIRGGRECTTQASRRRNDVPRTGLLGTGELRVLRDAPDPARRGPLAGIQHPGRRFRRPDRGRRPSVDRAEAHAPRGQFRSLHDRLHWSPLGADRFDTAETRAEIDLRDACPRELGLHQAGNLRLRRRLLSNPEGRNTDFFEEAIAHRGRGRTRDRRLRLRT